MRFQGRCMHLFSAGNAGMAAHSNKWAAVPAQTWAANPYGWKPGLKEPIKQCCISLCLCVEDVPVPLVVHTLMLQLVNRSATARSVFIPHSQADYSGRRTYLVLPSRAHCPVALSTASTCSLPLRSKLQSLWLSPLPAVAPSHSDLSSYPAASRVPNMWATWSSWPCSLPASWGIIHHGLPPTASFGY